MEVPKSKSSSLVDWPGGLSIEPVMADQIGHEVKEAWQLPDCTLPKFAERRIANESVTGTTVVNEATRYLHYKYAYSGANPKTGFSCIGLVYYVFQSLV